ncbi:MAG TPA: hypothetical protein VH008_11805, partial [Pseudonocardia sp.]|nr:hypothetical protein [Pseudonocardia sp.]
NGAGADSAGDNSEPRLNRRVPQTHLAPELRLPSEVPEPPARPPADVTGTSARPPSAAHALTSYQANRNAAAAAWTDPSDVG